MPQRLAFTYHGEGSVYSCAALATRLQTVLRGIGAREDVHLSAYTCDGHSDIARFEIQFYSPAEATPENVRELTTYDSRDELIARARGETLPSAQDLPRFQAHWRKVSFARDRHMRLQPADCNLVRAVREQILVRMTSVRIVRDSLFCSPHAGAPNLTVAALVPVDSDGAD